MRFKKRVLVIAVTTREVRKNGEVLKFHDLKYVVPGEDVGKLAVTDEHAVGLAQLTNQEVDLECELEQDSRVQWLYRCNVRSFLPVESKPAKVG